MNLTRFIFGTITLLLTVLFTVAYFSHPSDEWWVWCYTSSIILSLIFLWLARANLLTLSPIFITIYLVAIVFPAIPYIVFDLEAVRSFHESVFLNALGLMAYLLMSFYLFPVKTIRVLAPDDLYQIKWQGFFHINQRIFVWTLPIVLFVVIYSGGWRVFYLGFDSNVSGFDRMSTLRGMGTLMIFSYLNIYSGTFLTIGYWIRARKKRAVALAIFFLTLNGFTGGRAGVIWFFMAILLFYGIRKGVNWRIVSLGLLGGFGIIMMKLFRSSVGHNDLPWQIALFAQFSGDFDSLNNVSALLEYVNRSSAYTGFYHIWSNILVFIPRFLLVDKPYDIGGLYLNTLVFPGIFLGAQGGTGFSFGVAGVFFAAAGIITLVFGCASLALITCWFDRNLAKVVNYDGPSQFLILYLMLLGQVVVLYRDGLYALMNMLFFYVCYRIVYLFFQRID